MFATLSVFKYLLVFSGMPRLQHHRPEASKTLSALRLSLGDMTMIGYEEGCHPSASRNVQVAWCMFLIGN